MLYKQIEYDVFFFVVVIVYVVAAVQDQLQV